MEVDDAGRNPGLSTGSLRKHIEEDVHSHCLTRNGHHGWTRISCAPIALNGLEDVAGPGFANTFVRMPYLTTVPVSLRINDLDEGGISSAYGIFIIFLFFCRMGAVLATCSGVRLRGLTGVQVRLGGSPATIRMVSRLTVMIRRSRSST